MKPLAILLLLCAVSLAKDTNLSDYSLRARMTALHMDKEKGPIRTTTYRTVGFEIGSVLYTAEDGCKNLVVGTEYPAKMDKKHLTVLDGGRACKMSILDVREK